MSPEDVLKVHSTRLLLLSVTNNFAGLEEFPARDIFKCLKNNGMLNAMLFYALKNNDGYRARALAEHLFRAAILAGDGEITHQLLETGHVSANSKLLFDGEEKESPIQAAAAVRSPAVVQVLLSAGADLHGESLDFWGSEPPKEWTLSHPNTYISHWAQNELLDITNTFLEAGVVPELSHVTRLHDLTGSTCEQRILDMLIPRLQPLEHWCCEGTHIIEIMSKLEESQVAMLVARLSSGPTTPDCQRCLHLLESLLLAAACIGMIEVFQSLLTKIISRSNPEFWGTLLSASIRGDNQAIINIALEQGYMTSKDASHLPDSLTEIYSCRREKDSCDQESHFTSPLAEAIRSKNSILVEKLEAAGALTRLNYHGHLGPAIRAAVAVRDLEYAKKILMHAPRAPEIGYSPELTGAIEEDREDLVQILLDADQYLVFAVHNNNLPVVRELVDAGAEPLKDDILALAVEYSPTALQYLLSKAPQRPYGRRCLGSTALYRAVELGSQAMESLDTLLAATIVDKKCMIRFGINQFQSPLGLAIMRSRKRGSDLSIVKKLLGAGCDANSIVKSDRLIRETALLAAIGTGNQDLVQFLTRHGADINKRMTLGIKRTPLQRAVETGSLDMVKWLIDNGADVNAAAARRGGGTALQLAAIGGSCNIVAELLGCGADMYAAPSQAHGSWPLEGAAEHGRLEILEYLWKAAGGFDKFHCQRAWEFAENNGHYACRDWLADKLASLPDDSVMSI
ncbi:ankyrin [Thozetella sp. PMI_491]|nr:ankyrin [Thozetella sp. PMI_491]